MGHDHGEGLLGTMGAAPVAVAAQAGQPVTAQQVDVAHPGDLEPGRHLLPVRAFDGGSGDQGAPRRHTAAGRTLPSVR